MPERHDPKTVAVKLNAKQKRERAVRLRTQGLTWQQIADQVGYAGPQSAHAAVAEYFRHYPSPDADELRAQENLKLDELEQAVRGVLTREHVVIQHGKVVGRFMGWMTDSDGQVMTDQRDKPIPVLEEIQDDAPVLQAVGQLLRIAERRAKLNGLDRPVVIRIEDEAGLDQEIEELVGALNKNAVSLPPGHEG